MYSFLLLVTSFLYAGNIVSGKFLINYTSPLTVTDLRWGMAVLLLFPIVWIKEKQLLPSKRAIVYLFVMGLTGVALYNIFTYLALRFTTPDDVGLLTALNPIVIALASFVFLRERIKFIQSLGMLLSLLGVLIVVSHGHWQRIVQLHFDIGDLWVLVADVTWGLFAVSGRKAMEHVSPYIATLWAGIFGVLVMLPFDLPVLKVAHPDATFWGYMLYSSIGGTILATVFWNIGIEHVGPTKSGMFLNFNAIFTAILSYVLLREHITAVQIVGMALVIAGVSWFTLLAQRCTQKGTH